MGDFFWKVLTALRPSDNPDPEIQSAWRWAVASVLSSLVVVYAVSFCWAQGWIPGISGVAWAADVSALKRSFEDTQHQTDRKIDAIRLMLVKNDIEKAMTDSCIARDRRNQDALNMANAKLYGHDGADGLIDQYRDLTGHGYDQKDCRALLITNSP